MIMRASFVEGIMSMARVRICSIGFLIAPLVGAMDDCFLIQQRDNQKSIWWRTAGSNSAIANKVTVRRAEVSVFPLRLRFDCIHSSVRWKGGPRYICSTVFVLLYQPNLIPHQGKRWK